MIGAPFLQWVFNEDWNNAKHPAYNKNVYTRPTKFIPVFHKYTNDTCSGLHLMIHEEDPNIIRFRIAIQLLKYIKEKTPAFEWKEGKYEAFNDKKAIELLTGDKLILDYFDNKNSWKEVKAKLAG